MYHHAIIVNRTIMTIIRHSLFVFAFFFKHENSPFFSPAASGGGMDAFRVESGASRDVFHIAICLATVTTAAIAVCFTLSLGADNKVFTALTIVSSFLLR
jgi:hypothetical protein